VVVTEWNEFKQINLEKLKSTMTGNFVFDGRNLYDPAKMTRLGFQYYGIGRGTATAPAVTTVSAPAVSEKVVAAK